MNRPVRIALAVLAALVGWVVLATLCGFAIRAAVPGYTAVEKSMEFTTAMLLARLIASFVATFGCGAVCAWAARSDWAAAKLLAVALLAVFVPMHLSIWQQFPVWYHLTFFASLAALPLAGFRFATNAQV